MKLTLVPARTGLHWVKRGLRTFIQQPMALTSLFFMVMALMSMVALVPVIGAILALILLPLATLVMMVATEEAMLGKRPLPSVLVSAWRAGQLRLQAMLVLGALYAAGFLLCMGFSALFDGGQLAQVYLFGGKLSVQAVQSEEFQRATWAMLVLYLPLSLLFWHAPGLVHWHGVSPLKSLFFSLVACWRNRGAFLLYGIAWIGVVALGGVLLSLLSALLLVFTGAAGSANIANIAGGSGVIAAGLMMVGMLMLAAMLFTSIYATFRDCFSMESDVAPGSTGA